MKKIIILMLGVFALNICLAAEVKTSNMVNLIPPVAFAKVTQLKAMALSTNDTDAKMAALDEMAFGVYHLPPCRIYTSTSMMEIATSGDREVKIHLEYILEEALANPSNMIPIPSFVFARMIMENHLNVLRTQIK